MGKKKGKGQRKPTSDLEIQAKSSMDIRSTRIDEEPGVAINDLPPSRPQQHRNEDRGPTPSCMAPSVVG